MEFRTNYHSRIYDFMRPSFVVVTAGLALSQGTDVDWKEAGTIKVPKYIGPIQRGEHTYSVKEGDKSEGFIPLQYSSFVSDEDPWCSDTFLTGFPAELYKIHEVTRILDEYTYAPCDKPGDSYNLGDSYDLKSVELIDNTGVKSKLLKCEFEYYTDDGETDVIELHREGSEKSPFSKRLRKSKVPEQRKSLECNDLLLRYVFINNRLLLASSIDEEEMDNYRLPDVGVTIDESPQGEKDVHGSSGFSSIDHMNEGSFGDTKAESHLVGDFVELTVRDHTRGLPVSDCRDVFTGFDKEVFLNMNIAQVLINAGYTNACPEPLADDFDLGGNYRLQDLKINTGEKDQRSLFLECKFEVLENKQSQNPKRILKFKRIVHKVPGSPFHPPMWKRIYQSKKLHNSAATVECKSMLQNFITISNAMVSRYELDNPTDDVGSFYLPEIGLGPNSKQNKNKSSSSSSLAPGYIVLIVASVFLVLGLTWYMLTRNRKAPTSTSTDEKTALVQNKNRKISSKRDAAVKPQEPQLSP